MQRISPSTHGLWNRRQVLAMAGIFASGMARPAFAATPIGKAITVDGEVALGRAAEALQLLAEDPLLLEDKITTRQDGFAILLLDDRTTINLGADSELTIEQFLVDQGGTMSVGGAMLFDRPEGLPPINSTILTAFGQIGVRGTRFFVGPTKGKFSVFVDHGSVSVSAQGVERILGPGDGVDFAKEGDPPGEVVKWGEPRIAEAFALVRAER